MYAINIFLKWYLMFFNFGIELDLALLRRREAGGKERLNKLCNGLLGNVFVLWYSISNLFVVTGFNSRRGHGAAVFQAKRAR